MRKIILFLLLVSTSISWSQKQNFSEEVLGKFAKAYIEVRTQNMNYQLNMITAIEKAGLTSDSFNEIHMSLNDPNRENPTQENKLKYDNALKNIKNLKKDIQKSIERIIEDNGLKVETYQAIAEESSTNVTLKNKINNLIN